MELQDRMGRRICMETELEQVLPEEIEARSFEIITKELGSRELE